MNKNIRHTDNDWDMLQALAAKTATELQRKLPSDWQLTFDEIKSAAYGSIVMLLQNYESGALSPVSYCYQYCGAYTLRDLLREYNRVKSQLNIIDLLEPDDEDGNTHREYGAGDVKAVSIDEREKTAS